VQVAIPFLLHQVHLNLVLVELDLLIGIQLQRQQDLQVLVVMDIL
jgi:predicted homoserine dehydrogenase-like protein